MSSRLHWWLCNLLFGYKIDFLAFLTLDFHHIFFLACYSYISDITTKENRTKRLAYLDGIHIISFALGMTLSGYIKHGLGLVAPFAFAICGSILCILYIIFILKDSRNLRPKEVMEEQAELKPVEPGHTKNIFSSMFDLDHPKSALKATFGKRPNGLRNYVVFLAMIFILAIVVSHGPYATNLLYLRKVIKWQEREIGVYYSLWCIIGKKPNEIIT